VAPAKISMKQNPWRNFKTGLNAPFAAFAFLKQHKSLTKYILIPFIINLVIFSLAAYLGFSLFESQILHRIPQNEAWYWSVLNYASWLLAILLTAVLVFFSFTVIGSLVASPFNEILSERTEQIVTGGKAAETFHLRIFFKDAISTFLDESRKIALFVTAMILLLMLNLVPIIGTLLYPILSTILIVFFLAVEYTGYVFSRKRLPFREQRRYLLKNKSLWVGFGIGLLLILAIPLVQFFCIPLGVIGATRLYLPAASSTKGEAADAPRNQ
jgi:CysZ protein